MSLQDEIEAGRKTIRTDQYSMSIGEIANLYRDGELVIRPEFQRLFRWKLEQKSRLIESILLGIPLPSIFLNQRRDGIWEVVDGLQRLSTIFEFMGELKSKDGEKVEPPSILAATEYLPSLDQTIFDPDFADVVDTDAALQAFTPSQRLAFKRAKLDLKILQPESDVAAKYELFDRLNAGGSVASPQEVRNAQLLLRDPSMARWMGNLFESENYKETLSITDRLRDEGYDQELIFRYLAIRYTDASELANIKSVDEFFSSRVFELALDQYFNRDAAGQVFQDTFSLIHAATGEDSFRRYDPNAGRFKGYFSVSAFETISVGVSHNIDAWATQPAKLEQRIKELWDRPEFRAGSKSGTSASSRIPKTIPFAIEFFS